MSARAPCRPWCNVGCDVCHPHCDDADNCMVGRIEVPNVNGRESFSCTYSAD